MSVFFLLYHTPRRAIVIRTRPQALNNRSYWELPSRNLDAFLKSPKTLVLMLSKLSQPIITSNWIGLRMQRVKENMKLFLSTSLMICSTSIQSKNNFMLHYNDVIMGAIASQINSLTIVSATVNSDAYIKAPRHWPLCGEFIGDQWIPCTNGQ